MKLKTRQIERRLALRDKAKQNNRGWRERGQELVEFALVIPVVMMVIMAILEFGMLIFSYNTISNAAREGARYGSVFPTDSAGIEDAALGLTTGLNQDPTILRVTISRPDEGDPRPIRVVVTYDYTLMTGNFFQALGVFDSPVFTIQAASTMQVE